MSTAYHSDECHGTASISIHPKLTKHDKTIISATALCMEMVPRTDLRGEEMIDFDSCTTQYAVSGDDAPSEHAQHNS